MRMKLYEVNMTRVFLSAASQMSTIILSRRFCMPGSARMSACLVVTFLA